MHLNNHGQNFYLGEHVVIDFYNCASNIIYTSTPLSECVTNLANELNLTILSQSFHQFQPHGVSGVLMVAESHISIHTWPEHSFVAIDIFSCKPILNINLIVEKLSNSFESNKNTLLKIHRGKEFADKTF